MFLSSSSEESCHLSSYAYFKEGIILLNLLEIFLCEDPFAFLHQLVCHAISLHHFEKAVENPFQLTQTLVRSAHSNTTGHQLPSLPKSPGWSWDTKDTHQKSVSEIFIFTLACLTMSGEVSVLQKKVFLLFFFHGGKQG